MLACNVSLSLSWNKDGMMIKDAFNRSPDASQNI